MQAQAVEGTYANQWESQSGEAISYELTLREDGTFTFISIRTYLDAQPKSKSEIEGIWKFMNRTLELFTTTQDNNQLAKDLNMNKARYISISPRNPNFNLVMPSFKFYESKVFYSKNMELIKIESVVTLNN